MFLNYNETLVGLADQFAPKHTIRSNRQPLTPWVDDECRLARRTCRRLERRYRRSLNQTDLNRWVAETRKKFDLFRRKKDQYWLNRFKNDGLSSRKLWRSMKLLLGDSVDHDQSVGGLSADGFTDYFQKKVELIRNSFEHSFPPEIKQSFSGDLLDSFKPITEEEIRSIILSSPSKTNEGDPIPTFLLKELIDVLLGYITAMINASFQQALLPSSEKESLIIPRLKKQNLDSGDYASYRPISNLTFISKTIERVIAGQMLAHLNKYHLLPKTQSAYRQNHSTETALLHILSDAFKAADKGKVTMLILLDLTAAFELVDHEILLQRLRLRMGLDGAALLWIRTYLTDRTMRVCYHGSVSSTRKMLCGVPQGSILGPLLFAIFISELGSIETNHQLNTHYYADDIQLYHSHYPDDAMQAAELLSNGIGQIQEWLSANRLKLNPSKSELICLGQKRQIKKVMLDGVRVGSDQILRSKVVRNLGVFLDEDLSMADHISRIVSRGFLELRKLRSIITSVTREVALTLVHALVCTRLDYCNSLLAQIKVTQLKRLQSLQNAAARLITETRMNQHISPVLRELHWLPVIYKSTV